ncbi:recombinase family protein [Clostridium magnum]|uniref:recombinase family protein n=1 Tax=Clostridium magnum TaxID=33954 RepID=UPI000836B9EA|nr:recombinase family protein [Clostridium magnum]
MTISNSKAAVCIRVSTTEQSEKLLSPEYQKEQVLKYIDEYNENIDKKTYKNENDKPKKLELYEDKVFEETKPASTIFTNNVDKTLEERLKSRPILQYIIDLAQNKKIGHLIVLVDKRF